MAGYISPSLPRSWATLSIMTVPIDYGDLEFTRPADKIKAVDVPDIPQGVFAGMKAYEDAARGI